MAAEADLVQEHLERGDRPQYSILHYLGHGYRAPQEQDGYLVFENRGGTVDYLDVARLGYVLVGRASEFKLAIISACQSESVAEAIFTIGVDFVIAIEGDQSVYEAAAVAFYRRFYQSLLTGNTLDQAFVAGQRAISIDETRPVNWSPVYRVRQKISGKEE
jgi:CHAT domain